MGRFDTDDLFARVSRRKTSNQGAALARAAIASRRATTVPLSGRDRRDPNEAIKWTDAASAQRQRDATDSRLNALLAQPGLSEFDKVRIRSDYATEIGSTVDRRGAFRKGFDFLVARPATQGLRQIGRIVSPAINTVSALITDAFLDDTTIFGGGPVGSMFGGTADEIKARLAAGNINPSLKGTSASRGEITRTDFADIWTENMARVERNPDLWDEGGNLFTSQLLTLAGWDTHEGAIWSFENLPQRIARFGVSVLGDYFLDPLSRFGARGKGASSASLLSDGLEQIDRVAASVVARRLAPEAVEAGIKTLADEPFGVLIMQAADDVFPAVRTKIFEESAELAAARTALQETPLSASFMRQRIADIELQLTADAQRAAVKEALKSKNLKSISGASRFGQIPDPSNPGHVWDASLQEAVTVNLSLKRFGQIPKEFIQLRKAKDLISIHPSLIGGITFGGLAGRSRNSLLVPGTIGLGARTRAAIGLPLNAFIEVTGQQARVTAARAGLRKVQVGLSRQYAASMRLGADGLEQHLITRQVLTELTEEKLRAVSHYNGTRSAYDEAILQKNPKITDAEKYAPITEIINRQWHKLDGPEALMAHPQFAELGLDADPGLLARALAHATTVAEVVEQIGTEMGRYVDFGNIDGYMPVQLTAGARSLTERLMRLPGEAMFVSDGSSPGRNILAPITAARRVQTSIKDPAKVPAFAAREHSKGQVINFGGESLDLETPVYLLRRELVTDVEGGAPTAAVFARVSALNREIRKTLKEVAAEHPNVVNKKYLRDDFQFFEENADILFKSYLESGMETLKIFRLAEAMEAVGRIRGRELLEEGGGGFETKISDVVEQLYQRSWRKGDPASQGKPIRDKVIKIIEKGSVDQDMKKFPVAGVVVEVPATLVTPEFQAQIAILRSAFAQAKADIKIIVGNRANLRRALEDQGHSRDFSTALISGMGDDVKVAAQGLIDEAAATIAETQMIFSRAQAAAVGQEIVTPLEHKVLQAQIDVMRNSVEQMKLQIRGEYSATIREAMGSPSRNGMQLDNVQVQKLGAFINGHIKDTRQIARATAEQGAADIRSMMGVRVQPVRRPSGTYTEAGRDIFMLEQRVQILDALDVDDYATAHGLYAQTHRELERAYVEDAVMAIYSDLDNLGRIDSAGGWERAAEYLRSDDLSFADEFFSNSGLRAAFETEPADMTKVAKTLDDGAEALVPLNPVDRRMAEAQKIFDLQTDDMVTDLHTWAMTTSTDDGMTQLLSPEKNPFALLANGKYADASAMLQQVTPQQWHTYTQLFHDAGGDPWMVLRPYFNNRTKAHSIALVDNAIMFEKMPLEIVAGATSRTGAKPFGQMVDARRRSLVGSARVDVGSPYRELLKPHERQKFVDSLTAARKKDSSIIPYTDEEYLQMRVFLSADGQTGYALKPIRQRSVQRAPIVEEGIATDFELVSMFGGDADTVADAVWRGATVVEAFEGSVPEVYGKGGFVEFGRETWNPVQAPTNWDGGTPATIFMRIKNGPRQFYEQVRKNDSAANLTRPSGLSPEMSARLADSRWETAMVDHPEVAAILDSWIQLEDAVNLYSASAAGVRRSGEASKKTGIRMEQQVEKLASATDVVRVALEKSLSSNTRQGRRALLEVLWDDGWTVHAKVLDQALDPDDWLRLRNNAEYLAALGELPEKFSSRIPETYNVRAAVQNAKQHQDAMTKMFDVSTASESLQRANDVLAAAEGAVTKEQIDELRTLVKLVDSMGEFGVIEDLNRTTGLGVFSTPHQLASQSTGFRSTVQSIDEILASSPLLKSKDARSLKEALHPNPTLGQFTPDGDIRLISFGTVGLGNVPFKHKVASPQMVEFFGNFVSVSRQMYTPGDMNVIKAAFRRNYQWWKSLVTVQSGPSFHLRNAWTAHWNNMLHGVRANDSVYGSVLGNVHRYRANVRDGVPNLFGDIKGTYTNAFGTFDTKLGFEAAHKVGGVLDASFSAHALGRVAPSMPRKGQAGWFRRHVGRPRHDDWFLARAGKKSMETVEDTARMALFLKHYDPTFKASAETGRSAVLSAHFDYSDLSALEMKVKNFVPFFTWASNNLQLQARYLLERPEAITRYWKLQQNVYANFGGSEDPSMGAPEWFGALAVPTSQFLRKDEPYWMRMWFDPDIPVTGLLELPLFTGDPINPRAWVTWVANGLGPQFDFIEQILDEPGYTSAAPAGLAQILQLVGVGESKDGVVKTDPFLVGLFNTLVPLSRQIVDPWMVPGNARQAQGLGFEPDVDPSILERARAVGLRALAPGFGVKTTSPADQAGIEWNRREGIQSEIDRLKTADTYLTDDQIGAASLEAMLRDAFGVDVSG